MKKRKKRRWIWILLLIPAIPLGLMLALLGCTAFLNLTTSHSIDLDTLTGNLDITMPGTETETEYLYTPEYVTDSDVVITSSGTYILSGSYQSIYIRAGATDVVQLVLDNAVIVSNEEPAILAQSAQALYITLASGTENYLSDSGEYQLTGTNVNADGTIFSRVPLIINGSGTLNVEGNYSKAIVSKDSLTILDGTLNVQSTDSALDGKDCVKIYGGTLNITAGADGIRSTNSRYSNKGFVYIAGGTIRIASGNDGIQAESVAWIAGGSITVTSGGGSSTISNTDRGPGMFGFEEYREEQDDSDAESTKGIKAGKLVYLTGGDLILDCLDDAIHSNGSVLVAEGSVEISTNDDAIHAENVLMMNSGSVVVAQCYEGFEALYIEINNGTVNINAVDDGVNATDGSITSVVFSWINTNLFHLDNYILLKINGGYTYVCAQGDGLDSNGDIIINGGTVLVSTASSGEDIAIDVDGKSAINGGTVIAAGASSMDEEISESTGQSVLLYYCDSGTQEESITILNEEGSVILYFEPAQSYSTFTFSSPVLESGDTVTVLFGVENSTADENGFSQEGQYEKTEDAVDVTIGDGITTYGSRTDNRGGGGPGMDGGDGFGQDRGGGFGPDTEK
ncbi:MAG: carbohydrate-binding domain-containing protein [Lachnospiraceae bacterium]|nr:carbohydrate-binding domain-containing protein [Lachnospiraceae bacterium]